MERYLKSNNDHCGTSTTTTSTARKFLGINMHGSGRQPEQQFGIRGKTEFHRQNSTGQIQFEGEVETEGTTIKEVNLTVVSCRSMYSREQSVSSSSSVATGSSKPNLSHASRSGGNVGFVLLIVMAPHA